MLSTQVSHTLQAIRAALAAAGTEGVERAPGVLAVMASDPSETLRALRRALSSMEAAEVRVAQVSPAGDDDLLAAALAAPTLAQAEARVAHADLLPLFADELGSFRSVYQPIVDLTGAGAPVVGYEALLRATGPGGPVEPAALFGAAGQAGWLHVLDRVGRTTALRGAGGWLGERLLFINFLPTTIYRPEVCLRTTEQAARQAGLRLDQLVFEVTESERVSDIDHLAAVFSYYRQRGCRVALDDLGAGYSSLNMLVRLQPDVVKLDKEIVQDLPHPTSVAVMRAVIEITHAYGGKVLAECIETAEQAETAIELGVDLGQGWLFGRPEERAAPGGPGRAGAAMAAAGGPAADPGAGASEPGAGVSGAGVSGPGAPDGRLHGAARGTADVEALMTRALEACSGPVSIADATAGDLPLVYVNPAFEQATGYRADEVLGRNCRFLQDGETDPATVAGIREAVHAGRDHVAVLRNRRKDGRVWWNELHISPVTDMAGRVTHYFGFQHDVTARVEAEREAAYLADHDPLTGLPNRRRLLAELDSLLGAAAPQRWAALLFVDLDGFKGVNDRFGHAGGDVALTAAGARLRAALGGGALLARYSGDEFVAVVADLPAGSAASGSGGAAAVGAAVAAAEDRGRALIASLAEPIEVHGEHLRIGASVGVAVHPVHASTPDGLLRAADLAMYAAKDAGGGRTVVAVPPGAGGA